MNNRIDNDQVKFAVFSDLHTDIINNPEERISEFIKTCNKEKVDFAIQLGDFILPPHPGKYDCDDEDVSVVMKNILAGRGITDERKRSLLAMFDELEMPLYHAIGNHDLDLYSKDEISTFWGLKNTYYSFDVKNKHFIVLDLNYILDGNKEESFCRGNYLKWFFKDNTKFPYLPKAEIEWLYNDLANTDKDVIIFSHEGINNGFLNAINSNSIIHVLSSASSRISLCMNGHKHQDLFTTESGIPFYSLNSISGYSVPSQYAQKRFSDKIEEEYPNLKYMFPYNDPLFVVAQVDDDSVVIKGRYSSFIDPTPNEVEMYFDDPSVFLTPFASSIGYKQEILKSDIVSVGNSVVEKLRDVVFVTDSTHKIRIANSAFSLFFLGNKNTYYNDTYLNDFFDEITLNKHFYKVIDKCINEQIDTDNIFLGLKDSKGKDYRFSVSTLHKKIINRNVAVVIMTNLTMLMNSSVSLVRYTSKNIAEYIVKDEYGKSLGGELKDVTIVMSDLRGFTSLSNKIPANALIEIVNNYFGVMQSLVDKYDGNILEFLGDGLFICFGAPNKLDNHAESALACAIEMQCAMAKVNAWNKEHGYPDLEMGIGINSGEVVVGNIGSLSQMRYACMGEQVNIAGRIEGYTIGYQILMSEATKSRIKQPLLINGQHKVVMKGIDTPINLYDVVGIGGKYDLSCDHNVDDIKFADVNIDSSFSFIIDKAVKDESYDATIVSISNKFAYITTDHSIEHGCNIMLNFCNGISAKVVKIDANKILVSFTSGSKELKEFLGKCFK